MFLSDLGEIEDKVCFIFFGSLYGDLKAEGNSINKMPLFPDEFFWLIDYKILGGGFYLYSLGQKTQYFFL